MKELELEPLIIINLINTEPWFSSEIFGHWINSPLIAFRCVFWLFKKKNN